MALCSKRDMVYSRYADDLTISGDSKITLTKTMKLVEKIANEEKFYLNPNKTRYLSPKSHKIVTGITVNDGILKANKALKKRLRAMIFRSIVTKDYTRNEQARGIIAYIDSIEKGYKNKIKEYLNNLAEKEIFIYFNDIVEEFNKNKIFKEVKDMNFKASSPFDLADLIEARNDYLEKIGFQSIDKVSST